jgi:hypothetical protein
MAKRLFVVVAVLGFIGVSLVAQSKPSIQGVWRVVEVTITNPNPAPGGLPKGTHTNLQPALLIFTGKHYSTTTDTAAKPRPTTGFNVAGKPTAEEMQSQWGPFAANAGTYELSGTTLTRRAIVAKNPANQNGKIVTRSTIKLDGNNLWITTTEGLQPYSPAPAGKVEYATTIKYVRVE